MSGFAGLSVTHWQIVRAFCDDDLEAGLKVLKKYSPSMREYFSRRGYARYVEDWEQETYKRIIKWIKSPNFDPDKSQFRSLVFTCLKRTITDEVKKLGRQPKEVELDKHPEAESLDREVWDEVYYDNIRKQALVELKTRVEAETWAAFQELQSGKSVDDVATAFGRDKQWVYDVKSRLLKMFREACLELDRDAI